MLDIHERGSTGYAHLLESLARRGDEDLARVEPDVRQILDDVRARGDEAVCAFAERFEGRRPHAVKRVTEEWHAEADRIQDEVRRALQGAAARIRDYHERQKESGFRYEQDGVELGQTVRPLQAVGVYAPGGKARYPSTVLMCAVPAAVAGVQRIVLATPQPAPEVLAAAREAGVTDVVDAGGAQAIAALTYGTETVPRVDKIVGPGNIFVACAKRLVFGLVDIDSIAGPSEALIIADDGADPKLVAADVLTQAEHDEDAYPMLITTSRGQAEAVDAELSRQLPELPRRAIAEAAVRRHGHCFVTGDLDEAARVANALAPEHLSLCVRDPDATLAHIDNAGCIFLGDHTPETAGDYAAGPSHVLPTGGAARYSSPLGVYDFVTRSSVIRYGRDALARQSELFTTLARLEGFEAHARAVELRTKSES